MLENIRLSFQGIWSHKLRSLLTMLGIIIGIASIISIVSTIQGTNEQIKQNLIGSGNNLVRLQLYQDDYLYDPTWEGLPDGVPVVSNSIRDELAGLDDVSAVAVYNRRSDYNNSLYYQNNGLDSCEVYGIESDYFSITGYTVKRGRNFVPKDYSDFRNVMLIDENVVTALFPGVDPLGKTVEYQSIAYVVIGVITETDKFEPVINSEDDYYTYMNSSMTGKVYVPNVCWPDIFAYDEPQEIAIQTKDTDSMSAVGKSAADILNRYNTNERIAYRSENLLERAKELQDLSNATNNQLIWIASISLLVGGIGVMNIMLVSVTERTREIGLKKAIGAKKKRILWQFLTEAAVLTSIGGIIGVIAGVGMSQLVSNLTQTPVSVNIPSIFVAVLFSMAIGIIFGLIPSVKASNLNPIEALRHE